jgi:hypothetical protein
MDQRESLYVQKARQNGTLKAGCVAVVGEMRNTCHISAINFYVVLDKICSIICRSVIVYISIACALFLEIKILLKT